MQVTLVPTEGVLHMWPKVRPHLSKVVEYTQGRYETDDILVSLTDYGHHLWVAFEDQDVTGVIVTTFAEYPRKRALNMVFCAGEGIVDWRRPMLDLLRRWAKDNHCEAIEASGRKGWLKFLDDDGLKPLWHTFELPVDWEPDNG